MKKLLYLLVLFLIVFSAQAQNSDTLSLQTFRPPPPPPLPPQAKKTKPNRRVISLPRFYSSMCESLSIENREKRHCSEKKLLEYIQENLKYPNVTESESLEGTVVIQFTVKKNGFLADIKVVRSLGKEYDSEAKRIVESMNKLPSRFIPAYSRVNRPVDISFNLPVKFSR